MLLRGLSSLTRNIFAFWSVLEAEKTTIMYLSFTYLRPDPKF